MKKTPLGVMLASVAWSMLPLQAEPAEPVVNRRQSLIKQLLTELSPQAFGPEYPAALQRQDQQAALRCIATYYRNQPTNPGRIALAEPQYDIDKARRAARGDVTIVNIRHQFPGGRIRFNFDITAARPPRNNEWSWQLNRMWFWNDMARAYHQNGDETYAQAFQNQIRDWIDDMPPPPDNGDYPGSGWRSIEAGIRLSKPWPLSFEVFRKSPAVADETLLLMLASMHEQARHLLRHGSATRPNRFMGNWIAMEMNGVYAFASFFPEFQDAAAMRRQALQIATNALREQLLPDGFQNELSPDYHAVVFNNNLAILRIARQYRRQEELPADFFGLLEKAATATLDTATPGLTQPRTNDCYTIDTGNVLRPAAEVFPERQDFRWAATRRREGVPPPGTSASRFLPWAGFAVMRSDWGPEAAYLCFDVGPLGRAHQHQDKLAINLYQGNEELLYDDGGGQYEKSEFYTYARTSAAHNTVTVDGLSQNRKEPRNVDTPIDANWITGKKFDYAASCYDAEFGPDRRPFASHRREVLFVKPDFFVIIDTLKTSDGKHHLYRQLFQLNTRKLLPVPQISGAMRTDFGKKYDLLLVPISPEIIQKTQAYGQMTPHLSGWYVGRNDTVRHPATTLAFSAGPQADCRFVTLLFPIGKTAELPVIQHEDAHLIRIAFAGKNVLLNLNRPQDGPIER